MVLRKLTNYYLAFISFVFCLSAYSKNYIYNPNFALTPPGVGWLRCTVNGCFYPYAEEERGNLIKDQFFAMNGPSKKNNYYNRGYVSYDMNNVLDSVPLYFYVEVGFYRHSDSFNNSLDVLVELKERGETFLSKNVELRNSDMWTVIRSDHPGYKRYHDKQVTLLISYDALSGKDFRLNYAQVGTDLLQLGGRGERDMGTVVGDGY